MISDLTFTVLSFSHLESDLWVEGNKSQHIVSKYWDFFFCHLKNQVTKSPCHSTHLVAMVLEEFHFLLREGCHGDGLDSMRRVQASPGTRRREFMWNKAKQKQKPNKQLGRHVCVNLMDWRFEGDCELTVIIGRLTNTETRTCQCVFMPGHKEGHCWKCAGYTRIYCVINLWFLFSSEPTCETWRSIMIIYNLNITFHLLYMSHSQSETVWLQNYQWLFICFASATMGHLSCWLEDMWFSDLRQTQAQLLVN